MKGHLQPSLLLSFTRHGYRAGDSRWMAGRFSCYNPIAIVSSNCEKFLLGADWRPPVELAQPIPRAVKKSPFYVAMLRMQMLICFGVAIGMPGTTAYTKWQTYLLQTRGLSAEGHVIGVLDHTKRRQALHSLSYEFQIASGKIVQGWDDVGRNYFDQLSTGSLVEIIYDPQKPERSAIRYPGMEKIFVFYRSFEFTLPIAIGALAVYGATVWLWRRQYSREARLLRNGEAVPAIVTNIRRRSFNGSYWIIFDYRLRDDGPNHPVTKYRIGSRTASELEDYVRSATDQPVALVDPLDHSRSQLYVRGYGIATLI